MSFVPEKLFVEEGVSGHPLTRRIISRLSSVPVVMVEDYKKLGEDKPFTRRADEDKNSLALELKQGELVKGIGRMESGQFYLFHEMDCRV